MSTNEGPKFATGKICYLVIPAIDIETSATFYEDVFGWHIRRQEDGSVSFDDSVNEVSGTWVTGLPPHQNTGLSLHLMVSDMDTSVGMIEKKGGKIIEPVGKDLPEITATFSDPAGNVFGLYQHRF